MTVLRLTMAGGRLMALLSVGAGSAATVVVAWTASGAGRWQLSAAANRGKAGAIRVVRSRRRGGTGAVRRTGEVLASPGSTWRQLPALPSGSQVLAIGAGGQAEALASHGSVLTVRAAGPAYSGWAREQAINVPIQYGSST